MNNKHLWKPTKFVPTKNGWRASRDTREVARGSRFMGDRVAEAYEKAIREHASGLLLDLGCGHVPLYGIYQELVEDNICIDWAASLHQSPHLDHEADLNGTLPLPDARFDTVLATDVLEHVSHPDRLWSEISRLVKDRGKLILGVPFFYWIHEEPFDHYRYTEYKLIQYCEQYGFEVVSLARYGGSPEVIFDIISKHLAFSPALCSIHVSLAGAFSRSRLGKKLSQRTEKKFPLGYCLVARRNRSRKID